MPKKLINLDVDLLRTFATIANAGSFTRAAEKLMRQQSTVSLQIKRLEDSLGHRLLERSPRAVSLTPEGDAVPTDSALAVGPGVKGPTATPAMRYPTMTGWPSRCAARPPMNAATIASTRSTTS